MSEPNENRTKEADSGTAEQQVYKGVSNNVYKAGNAGDPAVSLNYPEVGRPAIDASIKGFIKNLAALFQREVAVAADAEDEKPDSYDMWDMSGTYVVSWPNPDVISITFNIYSYSGGAHGNLLIRCLNYDLKHDRELGFDDLFKNSEVALKILSVNSAEKLRRALGDEAEEDMIESGTAPEEANFANLALLPAGLDVEFQPYQVGPWSIGPQHIHFSLAELAGAIPSPEIWPGAEDSNNAPQDGRR